MVLERRRGASHDFLQFRLLFLLVGSLANVRVHRVRHALGHHDTASHNSSNEKSTVDHHLACIFLKNGWVGVFFGPMSKMC